MRHSDEVPETWPLSLPVLVRFVLIIPILQMTKPSLRDVKSLLLRDITKSQIRSNVKRASLNSNYLNIYSVAGNPVS